MEEERLAIEDAPGKDLIAPIRDRGDLEAFAAFYRTRRDWRQYPIIHDGFITYGIFDDLSRVLPEEARRNLLSKAVSLAEAETDRLFLCAVFLVSDLIRLWVLFEDPDNIRPRLRTLRPRARKLSLFPNMTCFWNQIVSNGFPPAEHEAMRIGHEDWRQFTSLDLPLVDDHGWENCPDGDEAVRRVAAGHGGGTFVLEYKRSAVYDGAKYWIWLNRDVSANPVWHWYVFVVVTPEGSTDLLVQPMHSVVSLSPEELVVRHAYGLAGQ